MPVPPFQEFMFPLLRTIHAHGEMGTSDYYAELANEFGLTEEEKQETIPSGRALMYKNRIAWAGTHMVKAGLLSRPSRGKLAITSLGRKVLQQAPERIDLRFLQQFEGSREFRNLDEDGHRTIPEVPASTTDETDEALSPDEQLLVSYRQLRRSLADELLTLIKSAPPAFFEQLVVDLLVRMGYGGSHEDAGEAIGGSGDGGIDGIIKEDRLGLDFVYIQAKRWENVIGRPLIQGFAGSLEGQRARKGVFITTSSFTDNARDYVNRIEKRIVLIDGAELANLMLDYGIGVTDVATYKVQRIDPTYFGEE
jgi:restriction system protein